VNYFVEAGISKEHGDSGNDHIAVEQVAEAESSKDSDSSGIKCIPVETSQSAGMSP